MHSYQLNNAENFAHINGLLITSGAVWDSEMIEMTEVKFKLHMVTTQVLQVANSLEAQDATERLTEFLEKRDNFCGPLRH